MSEKRKPSAARLSSELWARSFKRGWGVLLAAILLWVYWPVLVGKYGYNDDYLILDKVLSHSFALTNNVALTQGRPLTGLVLWSTFSLAHSVDELRFGRMVSVAGIFLLTCVTRTILRRSLSAGFATAAALLLALSPGLVVCGAWLTAGSIPFAAAMALLGGDWLAAGLAGIRLGQDALGGGRDAHSTRQEDGGISQQWDAPVGRPWKLIGATLLLLAAYATYQPAAGLAIVACLAGNLQQGSLSRRSLYGLLGATVFLLLLAGFYLLVFRFTAPHFPASGQPERAAFSVNLLQNLHFVGTRILWSVLTGWTRFHASWLQWLTIFATLALLAGPSWSQRKLQPRALLAALLALGFGLLPFLILQEQNDNFRTQIALQATIIFLAIGGLQSWNARWPGLALASLLVAASALLARQHLRHDFIATNTLELVRLRAEVAHLPASRPTQVVFFSPAPAWLSERNIGEYRDFSSPAWWNTGPLLQLLLDERFGRPEAVQPMASLGVRAAQSRDGRLPIINGFRALERDAAATLHPQFGKIRETAQHWCVSSWFGSFYDSQNGWIRTPAQGWLQCTGKGPDDLWLWSSELGWFWTSRAVFPKIYLSKTNSWSQLALTIDRLEPWKLGQPQK